MFNQHDPRLYQIAVLSSLLVYGLVALDFEIDLNISVIMLGSALILQILFTKVYQLAKVEYKSALISSLSLCLLLRTHTELIAIMAATIAIASKFIFRYRNKHLFNPTNLALVALLMMTDKAWVSAGQWGHQVFFIFLISGLGLWVVTKAQRAETTIAFLMSYMGLLLLRNHWLGEPWAILFHQLENGALLIFAFFMISDPKTTPDHPKARVIFAICVSFVAVYIQFKLFKPNNLLYALAFCCVLTPIFDRVCPGMQYRWPQKK